MSYYTRLELEWDDTEEDKSVNEKEILDRVRLHVIEENYSDDLVEDIRVALKGPHNDGVGFNKMLSVLLGDTLKFISLGFPNTVFLARGAGEELLDTWIREYKNGNVLLSYGPWGFYAEADQT